MLVEMRTQITGYRNGEPWPAPGGTIDVTDGEAADLIGQGYAKGVRDAPTKGRHGEAPAEDSDEQPVADTNETPAEDSEPVEKPKRGSK